MSSALPTENPAFQDAGPEARATWPGPPALGLLRGRHVLEIASKRPVEDGGQQGIDFGGGLGL